MMSLPLDSVLTFISSASRNFFFRTISLTGFGTLDDQGKVTRRLLRLAEPFSQFFIEHGFGHNPGSVNTSCKR